MDPVTYTIDTTRHRLTDGGFKRRPRASDKAFTRVGGWPWAVVGVLILRKGVKSWQPIVNEAMAGLTAEPVTARAFSQARYPLQPTALIERNPKAVVDGRYREGNVRTFWDVRVLAIEGSKGRLADTDEVREALGTITDSNGKTAEIQGERP
jgi:hypothetical protein